MVSRLDQVNQYLQGIKALVPNDQDVQTYLRQMLDTQIEALSDQRPMGVVPPSMLSPVQVYASARTTVEFLVQPDQIAARPEGIVDLGTIAWLLRPALTLRDGVFDPPKAPPWDQLEETVAIEIAQAVCRLDMIIKGREPIQIGTGFIVGQTEAGARVVMTNAHVVNSMVRFGWPTEEHLQFACDFEREDIDAGGRLHLLTKSYHIHSSYDLALVYIDPNEQVACLPSATLAISATAPEPTSGLEIGVVGHPSFDSTRDRFPKAFGFGDAFGIKRFSPGFIRKMEQRLWQHTEVPIFLHDATTLSGSSGSCIFDLMTKRVIGLHFGGWALSEQIVETKDGDILAQLFEANGAVPLWQLVNDSLLIRCCVSFK